MRILRRVQRQRAVNLALSLLEGSKEVRAGPNTISPAATGAGPRAGRCRYASGTFSRRPRHYELGALVQGAPGQSERRRDHPVSCWHCKSALLADAGVAPDAPVVKFPDMTLENNEVDELP